MRKTITCKVEHNGKKYTKKAVLSALSTGTYIIDEKSEMAKLTGFEDDDTERIINLSLKKNRKRGVFGNYSAGLGADLVTDNGLWFGYDNQFLPNDFRYNANIFTNIMLDIVYKILDPRIEFD